MFSFKIFFIHFSSISMNCRVVLCAIIFIFVVIPKAHSSGRRFKKFWNYSLVPPSGTNASTITMAMTSRAECVSLCVHTVNCCCTQWMFFNNTCSILVADRAGLEPSSLNIVSSIDSISKYNCVFSALKMIIYGVVEYCTCTLRRCYCTPVLG